PDLSAGSGREGLPREGVDGRPPGADGEVAALGVLGLLVSRLLLGLQQVREVIRVLGDSLFRLRVRLGVLGLLDHGPHSLEPVPGHQGGSNVPAPILPYPLGFGYAAGSGRDTRMPRYPSCDESLDRLHNAG